MKFLFYGVAAAAEDFSLRKNKKPQQLLMHPNQSSCTDDRAMGKFGFEQEFLFAVVAMPRRRPHSSIHTHTLTYSPFIIAVVFHPQQRLIQAPSSDGH